MATTLDDLRAECEAMRGYDPDYWVKQMHRIPVAPVVDRVAYILRQCQGKRVLHLGCGWPPGYLHQAILQVAERAYGVDIDVPTAIDGKLQAQDAVYWSIDLDHAPIVPGDGVFDMILLPEILEHLGNPRALLEMLRHCQLPLLISAPNAHSDIGYKHVTGGIENVHKAHFCYYSWHTLKALVEVCGYAIQDFCWYNGRPGTAEGLIFLCG